MATADTKALRGKERIASLTETFPELPTSILLKTDVIRQGVRFTPVLPRIARWALPQTHLIFEWDHEDRHGPTDVTEGWDGTFNGVNCPNGVYNYVLNFEAAGNVLLEKEGAHHGQVLLLR